MLSFENLFAQLSNQEEVEGTVVGELATEVALFAAKQGITVFPVSEEPTLLKVLLKKGSDLFMLADADGYGVMFKYEGEPNLNIIDVSALG